MTLVRDRLLADRSLTGLAWCRALSDAVDEWLRTLLGQATDRPATGLALMAVGGYGRAELCPGSDLDVMLVHQRRPDVAEVAQRIWYPIWDSVIHLGHSVRTLKEALDLGDRDLDTATSLLSARHVGGDPEITAELAGRARRQWQKRSRRWLAELATTVAQRREGAGEVAFRLEPDLKDGRGGLRDVHALAWAEAAHPILLDEDRTRLAGAYSTLIESRVELQRRTGRPANVLVLEEQEGVAHALGDAGADGLMARVADAGRTVAWTSDDAWRRIGSDLRGPPPRIALQTRPLAPGVVLRYGEVALDATAAAEDPSLALRVAGLAARHPCVIERRSLERLAAIVPAMPDPWPCGTASLLVDLLATGRAAIDVIEALDRCGLWARILPEWQPVRARPQHNPYHRFTVDRHLMETAANAAELADRVDRPDLLVLAALLHDLGKGGPGDHTDAGQVIVAAVATRMGYPTDDVATLVALVAHHLLLHEVATRRDLDDPDTIERVASTVGDLGRLRLLAALTEADSMATGASAWGRWRAELVGRLVERAAGLLGGDAHPVDVDPFPTAEQLALLADGEQRIDGRDDELTVMAGDRPGIFSRIAGVLALHGIDVLEAAAHSTDEGRALARFRVIDHARDKIPWTRITADLERVLDGRLALSAGVADRARTYGRRRPPSPRPLATTVHVDNTASATATVIDVHAADRIGVLYRITRALAELDLDIRSARVQTLSPHVIDSFYVRDRYGAKVTESHDLAEIERAILHSLEQPDAG